MLINRRSSLQREVAWKVAGEASLSRIISGPGPFSLGAFYKEEVTLDTSSACILFSNLKIFITNVLARAVTMIAETSGSHLIRSSQKRVVEIFNSGISLPAGFKSRIYQLLAI